MVLSFQLTQLLFLSKSLPNSRHVVDEGDGWPDKREAPTVIAVSSSDGSCVPRTLRDRRYRRRALAKTLQSSSFNGREYSY